ncbi:hypothetical protein TMUPMC115_0919 [Tetragenococcus muriaticus PMC-11-5]|uniref:Uncharacterized protein n=1 Tax=Tetragenococcus muriaticus PMC-11-5 TaxID=1302649 RepID=A0A091C8B5_9ENTE|nr:hypothetical protein [Tetragenococcus muriaticus]KFN92407.1 hypothetical protein TMUPMC115_0919 [Tetragenococcus muriaticus PMC-11-5]
MKNKTKRILAFVIALAFVPPLSFYQSLLISYIPLMMLLLDMNNEEVANDKKTITR